MKSKWDYNVGFGKILFKRSGHSLMAINMLPHCSKITHFKIKKNPEIVHFIKSMINLLSLM